MSILIDQVGVCLPSRAAIEAQFVFEFVNVTRCEIFYLILQYFSKSAIPPCILLLLDCREITPEDADQFGFTAS